MKKILKNSFLLFLILSVSVISFMGCSAKEKNALKKISVSEVAHSVFYAPQYAAIKLGFFEEEGLSIDLSTGQGADAVTSAVLSGQVDIGFAGPEAAIYVYNEGRENYLKIFAQMTKRDGSFLVSRKKEDNFSFKDLKGKHILPGRKGGVPYMTFEYVLKQNGIDTVKDLKLDTSVQFAMMTSAFASGTADYVTAFEPTASMLQKEGKGHIVAAIGTASGEIPYTAYFASKNYISENPEIIESFTRAVYKGEKWCKEHSAKEIAETVSSFFPDTELSLLESAIQSYISIDAWNETPVMKKEAFTRLQDVISSAGELKKNVTFEKLVDNSFAEKVS